jgi:hypothetical protein
MALESVPWGSALDIFSDSQVVVRQFHQQFEVFTPELQNFLDLTRWEIQKRSLQVSLTWIPRKQNLAYRFLRLPRIR